MFIEKSTNPILTRWEQVLNDKGTAPALVDVNGATLRTFSEIEIEAGGFAKQLAAAITGNQPMVVGLQTGNCPQWPALILACWRRGLTILPLESTMAEAETTAVLEHCGASILIDREGEKIRTRPLPNTPPDWEGPRPDLLKLTSGTTSAPRAIRFRAAQLLADALNICSTMDIRPTDLSFGVIPFSHSYGFSHLITPCLCYGVPMVVSSDRMPRAILDGLEQSGATVFPGMPVFFQTFTRMDDTPSIRHVRTFISAGAPLPADVACSFREKFGRKIHSFLGASESGGICYDRSDDPNVPGGFIGGALDGVILTPIDSWDAEGGTMISVASDAVGDGYFPSPDPDVLGDGRFIPSDLVVPEGDGVRIVGRAGDIINVAGKKLNPLTVEAHLARHPSVRHVVVFGCGGSPRNEDVVACIELEHPVPTSQLLQYCRETLSSWQVPRDIWFVDQIPINERGKTSRTELATRYAARK